MSRRKIFPLLLALLVGAALLLRLWALNDVPPWLWWDEASQGLDARDLIDGHFRVFFSRAQGKEPLYVYLTVPFVAAFDGEPFAVRVAGALTGVAMVPALYAAGRALWRERPAAGAWAGAAAAAFWVVNFWPQSINRIGFQVNILPLILTLAVVAWLNWTHRPIRSRALFFGFLAGLTLWTYLAARITPLLWLALFLTLPGVARKATRPTWGWALLAFALTVSPLVLHFALHPEDAFQRVGGFATFYEAPDTGDRASLLLDSFFQVAGGFLGYAGDPIPRHNIPNRPPFSLPLALLFAAGALLAVFGLFRRGRDPYSAKRDAGRSWTLLLWLGVMAFPAFLSANSNPHFPRLLGALPAAFLIAAWPIAGIVTVIDTKESARTIAKSGAIAVLGFALLIGYEAARTIPAYFGVWAHDPALFTAFQGDLWNMAERIQQSPRELGVVAIDPSSAETLDYAFSDAAIAHLLVNPATVEEWMQQTLAPYAGRIVGAAVWETEPYIYADTQRAVPFYLAREGVLTDENDERGYILYDYRLDQQPQFTAAGQTTRPQTGLGADLTLLGARWGAAAPNPVRGEAEVAAGTSAWAILEWRLDTPLPGVRVAADLVDGAGHRLATVEQPLMAEDAPLMRIPADGVLRTYHLVEIPAAQPPGPIRLEARAYDAATGEARRPNSVMLGEVMVTPPVQSAGEGVEIAMPLEGTLGPGVRLLGRDAWPEAVAPGQDVTFRVYYQLDASLDADRAVALTLDGKPAATAMLAAGAAPGQATQAFVDLRVPIDLASGDFAIASVASEGGAPVELGTLTVAGRPAIFDLPAISQSVDGRFDDAVALVGLSDTPSVIAVAPGEAITVTLAWRALTPPERDLVRFVHLLGPGGKPVAQTDSAPCDGACLAPSWRQGEILTDVVRVAVPPDAAPGEYPLAVGWFDAESGVRLSAYDASGVRQPDDVLPLPVRVVIGALGDGS